MKASFSYRETNTLKTLHTLHTLHRWLNHAASRCEGLYSNPAQTLHTPCTYPAYTLYECRRLVTDPLTQVTHLGDTPFFCEKWLLMRVLGVEGCSYNLPHTLHTPSTHPPHNFHHHAHTLHIPLLSGDRTEDGHTGHTARSHSFF